MGRVGIDLALPLRVLLLTSMLLFAAAAGQEPERGAPLEPGSIAFVLAEHRLDRWAAKLERIGVEDVEDLQLVRAP